MEKISVIVPIYNVEQYLDRCIQSIVNQTYSNLEIILVDDGSPDSCPALCDQWAEKDSRIIVIHKENGGLSDARNAGLKDATGELIAFVDSDDWLALTFLEELYTVLVEHQADVAECSVQYVDEAGNVTRNRNAASFPVIEKMDALKRLILEDGIYQTVWNKLYRRPVIDGILFKKGKYNEDDFWTYLVFDRIARLAVVQKPLYHYLQRSTSIMGTNYSLKRLDGLEARFQRMAYLQKYDELASLTRIQLLGNCLYHYQCVLRWLQGEEQTKAKAVIQEIIKRISPVSTNRSISLKQRMWLKMFTLSPNLTAKVRNWLNIGL